MATTVEGAFRDFLTGLTPTQTERTAAESHRASIETCLKSAFEVISFFQSGSYGNGTSISGRSDVDYFVSLGSKDVPTNSTSLLFKVKDVLEARFPATGVCVRTPAVRLPFANGAETVEVVPASYLKATDDNERIYRIADGSGGWMLASPDAHNKYVRAVDQTLSGKAKPLIRFVKAWNLFRDAEIVSFYLELRTAKYASTQKTIDYAVDMKYALKLLVDCGLASMQDPKGISGLVPPCSETKRQAALPRLAKALERASNALAAANSGKTAEAIGWWRQLFGERFPSYG